MHVVTNKQYYPGNNIERINMVSFLHQEGNLIIFVSYKYDTFRMPCSKNSHILSVVV